MSLRNKKAGDTVWYQNPRGEGREVRIASIGRKYFQIEDFSNWRRFRLEDGREHEAGFNPPRTVWASREDWRTYTEAGHAWERFRLMIGCADFFSPADGVTKQDILQAAKLLKIELEPGS